MKKRWIILFILLLSFLWLLSLPGSAITYQTDIPSYLPYSGGAFIEVQLSAPLNTRGALIFPVNFQASTFGFAGSGSNLVNLSSGTVTGYLYTSSGTQYNARFTRLAGLEYQPLTGGGTWNPVNTTYIYGANVTFIDETTEGRQTDNYFYDKYQKFDRTLSFLQTAFLLILLLTVLLKRGN